MSKQRSISNSVLINISKVDQVLSEWIRAKGKTETYPEECIDILVEKGIYNLDSKGKAHYFREDLRTLRDCNELMKFENLLIEQRTAGAKWYIRLKG